MSTLDDLLLPTWYEMRDELLAEGQLDDSPPFGNLATALLFEAGYQDTRCMLQRDNAIVPVQLTRQDWLEPLLLAILLTDQATR